MSDANEPRNGEFEITPEEDRFVRAYFHRHAGRYLAAVGLGGIVAVCVTLASMRSGEPSAPSSAPQPEAPVTAALDELRSDSEKLRRGLAELRRQIGSQDNDASARVAALEKRLAAALQRLERLEQRAEAKPGHAGAPAADSIASSDLKSILERLYNLELRQEEQEAQRESSEQDLLERMFKVESRRDQLASAREQMDRSMLERLSSLEGRAFQLEKTVGGLGGSPPEARSAPAAPAP